MRQGVAEMHADRVSADNRNESVLANVPIVDFRYQRRDKAERNALRTAFDMEIRQSFLKSLAHRYKQDLQDSGFTSQNIRSLARGYVPRGYQVHHILPLDDGGTNDFSNLVLIRAHPEHEAVHQYLDPQIQDLEVGDSRSIKLPKVAPGIYRSAQTDRNRTKPAPSPHMIAALTFAGRHQR
jgi:hypothetical protein